MLPSRFSFIFLKIKKILILLMRKLLTVVVGTTIKLPRGFLLRPRLPSLFFPIFVFSLEGKCEIVVLGKLISSFFFLLRLSLFESYPPPLLLEKG